MFQLKSSQFMFRFLIAVAIVIVTVATLQSYQAQQSLAAGNIMLYSDNVGYIGGNLGGRTGADEACQAMSNKPAGFGQYRAFLSVAAPDEIQDMPANYGVPTNLPIVGSGGAIANDWADLLDGSIAQNLQTAIGVTNAYWTGSTGSGSLNTDHCTNWTTTSGNGWIGAHNVSGSAMWLAVTQQSCGNSYRLVCIAYGTATPQAVGGVAQTIALPTASPNLGYLARLVGVVMLVGAGWLMKR